MAVRTEGITHHVSESAWRLDGDRRGSAPGPRKRQADGDRVGSDSSEGSRGTACVQSRRRFDGARAGLRPSKLEPTVRDSTFRDQFIGIGRKRHDVYAEKTRAGISPHLLLLLGTASVCQGDCPARCSGVSLKIPSFRILCIRVVLFSPSLAAAPFGPPTTQLVSPRVAIMCALSTSASLRRLAAGISCLLSSATGARSSVPLVMTTERSTKFCSSLILPGQLYPSSAIITSSVMNSMDLPWRWANVRTK